MMHIVGSSIGYAWDTEQTYGFPENLTGAYFMHSLNEWYSFYE